MTEEYLPSRRTFLLRLSNTAQPQESILRGRIEHIPSGRTARFSSLQSINDFVCDILANQNGQNFGDNNETKENHNER